MCVSELLRRRGCAFLFSFSFIFIYSLWSRCDGKLGSHGDRVTVDPFLVARLRVSVDRYEPTDGHRETPFNSRTKRRRRRRMSTAIKYDPSPIACSRQLSLFSLSVSTSWIFSPCFYSSKQLVVG